MSDVECVEPSQVERYRLLAQAAITK